MLRFFKRIFGNEPSLDYQSIDDPRVFKKSHDAAVPASAAKLTANVDVKEPLLSKEAEGLKR